jgi:Tfp pilus assembly PilM family ATPase
VDKDQEISSTQRLLQHLRGRAKPDDALRSVSEAPAPRRSLLSNLSFSLRSKGAIVGRRAALGIEVSGNLLNLVKMVPSSGHWRAEEAASVRLEESQLPGTPEFVRVLRAQTARFSSLAEAAIWVLIPGSRGDIWHVRVPKVKKGLGSVVLQVARADRTFDPATTLFDYRIVGEVDDGAAQKHKVECYTVHRQDLKTLTDAVAAAGLQVAGVTLSTYAVKNFLKSRWVANEGQALVALHIDQEHTYVNLFTGPHLVASRVVRTGLNAFVQAIEAGLSESRRTISPQAMPDVIAFPDPSAEAVTAEQDPPVAVQDSSSSNDEAETGGLALFERLENEGDPNLARNLRAQKISEEQIFAWLQPVLARILRQAELTVDHALSELGFSSPARLLFSGYGSASPRFVVFMQEQLNIPVQGLDPLGTLARENSSRVNSLGMLERSRLALATGVAISLDEYTPNFLRTAVDRERAARQEQIGRLATLASLVGLVGVSALTWFATLGVGELRNSLAMEQRTLAAMDRVENVALLPTRADRVQARAKELRVDARRYAAVGLIGELIELTPEQINLLNVRLEWPARTAGSDQARMPSLVVEGFVGGAEDRFDTRLSSYLFRLQSSPLLAAPSIRRSEIERFGREGRVMRFMIHVQSASL